MNGITNAQQQGGGGGGGAASITYTKIESTIPTSAWVSSAPSWIGQNALTWTEKNEGSYYVQGGTEDLGLSSSGSYSAVVTIDGTDYSADVEGILPSDGTSVIYAGYFNNNNIELNIIDHCVGFDGNGEAIAGNGYLVMVIYMRGTVPSSVIVKSFSAVGGISAIISNSAIKVNSTVTMYIDYNGKIKAEEKTDGSITVSADETPTENIPYTLQVVETSAEGAFEIVNSYLPTIPETPTALPQEASALKSGSLPKSGWTDGDYVTYWTGSVSVSGWEYYKKLFQDNNIYSDAANDVKLVAKLSYMSTPKQLYNHGIKQIGAGTTSYPLITGYVLSFNSRYDRENAKIIITEDGSVYGTGSYSAGSSNSETWKMVGKYELKQKLYTISDTSITANSDVLMELTDEGGVKAQALANGSITLIRDTVPTQPIPYTYKVKQTNASGQFTLLNHYVPKVEIPTIPTKTSELINDSGYVSNLPTVRNVVCNDVDSATTLDTTITCEVGDLILAQIIVRSALTLPTDWTLLRTIPAVETSTNQTLSFAYKRATSTSETLTVTQATAGRIYTNLVRLSNAVSISYIQSCEKTGTSIKSISSTKPVTPNMVIWGAASATWNTSSPYGDWTYSPSTLDYYSLPQSTKQPRLGTFVDSNGAGERTFTTPVDSSTVIMCGAVEIVGDEVARKGDIPSATTLYEDSTGAATVTLSETINNGDIVRIKTNNGNVDHYYIGVAWNRAITVTESFMVTDESDVTVGTAININSLRFNIQDTSLILYHYFKTNITTAGAVTITNEKANVVIRKVERIHT